MLLNLQPPVPNMAREPIGNAQQFVPTTPRRLQYRQNYGTQRQMMNAVPVTAVI